MRAVSISATLRYIAALLHLAAQPAGHAVLTLEAIPLSDFLLARDRGGGPILDDVDREAIAFEPLDLCFRNVGFDRDHALAVVARSAAGHVARMLAQQS